MAEGKGGNQGLFSHQVSVTGQNGKLKPSHYLSFHFSFSDTTSMTQIFGAIVKQIWVLQGWTSLPWFFKTSLQSCILNRKRGSIHTKCTLATWYFEFRREFGWKILCDFKRFVVKHFLTTVTYITLLWLYFTIISWVSKFAGVNRKGKMEKKRQNYVFQINLSWRRAGDWNLRDRKKRFANHAKFKKRKIPRF